MLRVEQAENIVCLLDNENLIKIVASWGQVPVPINSQDIARLTGLSEAYINKSLEILYGNNVLDNEGHINQYAIQYIRSRVALSIKQGSKR